MSALPLSPGTAHAVHMLFEWVAIAIGMQLYRRQRARAGASGILSGSGYAVVIGCILGAAIGNKLVFWIEYPHLWAAHAGTVSVWMSGTSIVGGLLGGLLGVEMAKKLTGQRQSTGDQFVLPLIAGIAIGRIGCFLAGLNDGTYGKATALPWGVDFGDGIARHPTQLYDIAFVLAWGGLLLALRALARQAGPDVQAVFVRLPGLAPRRRRHQAAALRLRHGPGRRAAGVPGRAALLSSLRYLPILARQPGGPAPLKAIEP